jgi:aminoglycoside/choline kinase family phosphotransferase
MREHLAALFQSTFHEEITKTEELNAHGSDRCLFRLRSESRSVIGVFNKDRAENHAFLTFSRHFRKTGLPVPEIYGEDLDHGVYLEEDLGPDTLFDLLVDRRNSDSTLPAEIAGYYQQIVTLLPRFQIEGGKQLDYGACYPRQSFDQQSMAWDLNYFKYYFIKLAPISFNEQALEDDFRAFTDFLLEAPRDFFLYRDFQSRNIMIRNGEPWFIDYQGGRRGALQYDIASLLFDAKANLPFDARTRLLNVYLQALNQYITVSHDSFTKYYHGYVLMRILQAMGAYGFRGFYERKVHFLQSVPYAIGNLEYLLKTADLPARLPVLSDVLYQIVRSTRLRELGDVRLPMTVSVQSFSYRRGLPGDDSGHGGGFVFDCRALPNPGRLEEFKYASGNDQSVIDYLSQTDDVQIFLTRVRDLISQSVENYRNRNFSHLQVAFGCTGGQHRSVYCANQLARFLEEKLGVKVEVTHREKEHWPHPGSF